ASGRRLQLPARHGQNDPVIAIGRKNYLHVGSDAGGHTAAVMYTLLGTAKLNGINPQRYLRHVLERIAEHPINRIDELLPWAVAAKWEDDASAKDMPLAA
ncbi:MAG: transposase domain-containing protein, partial [Rubrivivax sp.]|nr:transposase domain-containing protein [Rubrivivax sp.]